MLIEQDKRWKKVVDRDKMADGCFVYAVKTTGTYCRPSCPSRRAKPQNVCFFTDSTEAEAMGFRTCPRCHPNGQSAADANLGLIILACHLITAADEMPKLKVLAARIGMSPYYFHRQFKAIIGLTPKQWARAQRNNRLREGLATPTRSITEAIYDAGFNTHSRFYEQSHEVIGMSPTAYKQGGKNEKIRFAIAQSTLGTILVACSEKGICAILLGEEADSVLRELQDIFPKANLIGDDKDFGQMVAQVIGFIEEPQIGLNLPLDIRGTVFQERVWQVLRQIAPGQIISYSDLARRIGQPKAVRAVARACATNKIAVAIPCHRVVRNDGALAGYRWGLERKQALLERESRT